MLQSPVITFLLEESVCGIFPLFTGDVSERKIHWAAASCNPDSVKHGMTKLQVFLPGSGLNKKRTKESLDICLTLKNKELISCAVKNNLEKHYGW